MIVGNELSLSLGNSRAVYPATGLFLLIMPFLGAASWVGPNDIGKLSSAAISDRVCHICKSLLALLFLGIGNSPASLDCKECKRSP